MDNEEDRIIYSCSCHDYVLWSLAEINTGAKLEDIFMWTSTGHDWHYIIGHASALFSCIRSSFFM